MFIWHVFLYRGEDQGHHRHQLLGRDPLLLRDGDPHVGLREPLDTSQPTVQVRPGERLVAALDEGEDLLLQPGGPRYLSFGAGAAHLPCLVPKQEPQAVRLAVLHPPQDVVGFCAAQGELVAQVVALLVGQDLPIGRGKLVGETLGVAAVAKRTRLDATRRDAAVMVTDRRALHAPGLTTLSRSPTPGRALLLGRWFTRHGTPLSLRIPLESRTACALWQRGIGPARGCRPLWSPER